MIVPFRDNFVFDPQNSKSEQIFNTSGETSTVSLPGELSSPRARKFDKKTGVGARPDACSPVSTSSLRYGGGPNKID